MARNRRDRRNPNQIVVHVTARVYEGLPFVPRRVMNRTIKGIIARGQTLYPVTIVAFLFMGNHCHWIFAGDGNRISAFMNYVQGEIAKAIQRFIPEKYDQGVWEDRFHEQRLVTEHDVVEKLIYLYGNPLEERLVANMSDYAGLSSFHSFCSGETSAQLCSWTPTRYLQRLNPVYSRQRDLEDEKNVLKKAKAFHVLTVSPLAWLRCFGIEDKKNEVQDKLLCVFREKMAKFAPLPNPPALICRVLTKGFKPKKRTRTPYLLCYDQTLRLAAIESYRDFCKRCSEAWKRLKQGTSVLWPIGGYRPYHGWAALRA